MSAGSVVAVAALLLLGGCERTARNMYDQPRYKPLARSGQWADGRASRSPPDGVVAHSEGTFAGTTGGRLGIVEPSPPAHSFATVRPDVRDRLSGTAAAVRAPTDAAALARGRERFDIFCAPCHSLAGDGDGMVVRRGFPAPPSFHSERLRQAPDAHFYAVITDGYGAMYAYATRVSPKDRLAIIGYIRALQLAQYAPVADRPAADRARLPPSAASPAGGSVQR